ncbi:MAG: sigma factor-like helix-turn-helix DNA-binding protein [Bacteroidota bacterium]|nr:sigma factor-like helix-turn-helix DNA-binding protein [Bacteroidota bacterium]
MAFYFKNETFKQVRNCGEKTNNELITMSKKYIEGYNIQPEDLEMDEDNYLFDKLKFYCYVRYGLTSETAEPYRQYFLMRRFPIFKFITDVLRAEFSDREYFIFINNFGYRKDVEKMTLQSVGDMYDITRERVRQIALYVPTKIQEIVTIFNEELYYSANYFDYKIDSSKNFIVMDEMHANKLNRYEYLDYTQKFYTFVFGELFTNFVPLYLNDNTQHTIYFLANKRIAKRFDFQGFYDKVYGMVNARVEGDYQVSYEDLIYEFILDEGEETYNIVKSQCDKLISKEFGLYKDKKNNILIKRNTLKKISEYIVEVLDNVGKPMTLVDIHETMKKMKIRVPQNIESLRSSILSIDEVTAIGKTSTYALKGWGEIVKTGTIKDIVYEFLTMRNDPIHIDDITDHVNMYRDTNNKNILSNLKLDRSGTFIFFRKGYVGLKGADYSTSKVFPNLKAL